MPFPFSEICTLLSRLEDIELRDPPILIAAEKSARVNEITESWFKSHRRQLSELTVEQAVALLSTLLPERRTDRVYGIQTSRLCRVLCRSLNFGHERRKDLEAYKQPGRGDLASCLERILRSGGPPATPVVDLMELDEMFDILAGNCRFSNSKNRLPPSSSEERDKLIGTLLKRLDATHSKWLVRLVLKNFSPVRVNETLVLKSFHFLLPDLLAFQDDLNAAIQLLKGPLKEYPDSPDPRSEKLHRKRADELLEPAVSTKVGRPMFYKARSIDNCMSLCGGGRWVLERKYDGEYCEVHIDMNRSSTVSECITIFSKSGKDSTKDREDLLPTLIESLYLCKPESKIKRRAILLGELVVYSDQDRCILPFEKVRKYVTRSGIFLGTEEDSQPHAHEHVAIVFFDLLLLDDEIVMRRPLEQRRMWLREVYTKIEGKAMGAEWKIVDFGKAICARKTLIQQLAASIAAQNEGLILKPCDQPYFNLESALSSPLNSYIKLKKDYISGMGDEADFAVIGGSYNSQQALKSGIANLKWTEFHLGCLLNKVDVLRFSARPHFKLVGTIDFEHCIPAPVLQAANTIGNFCATFYNPAESPTAFDIENVQAVKIDTLFSEPFVFEVLGSGFEKPSNCSFFMLRHPRVKKLHQDRTWKDCISMQELHEQAIAARAAPVDSESQETKRMIARLEAKCKKKIERQKTATPTSAGSTRSKATNDTAVPARTGCRRTGQTPASTELAIDGTTLIDTSTRQLKRPVQESIETPCPISKKRKTDSSENGARQHDKDASDGVISTRPKVPLADITSFASNASSPPRAPQITLNGVAHPVSTTKLKERPRSLDSTTPTSQAESRHREKHKCTDNVCLFSNAVVYAVPCIASTPYVMYDLLLNHNVLVVPTLEYWDRDSLAHPHLTETVAESQAFEGMRKVVLVESKRVRAVQTCIREILVLNGGKWRERAEVWDWRVLEECASHGIIDVEEAQLAHLRRKYFMGATMWDEGGDCCIFVRNV